MSGATGSGNGVPDGGVESVETGLHAEGEPRADGGVIVIQAEPPRPGEPSVWSDPPAELEARPSRDGRPPGSGAEGGSSRSRRTRSSKRAEQVGSPRQIIAVASGKGGAGKSVLATSIAIYLAQLNKRVVLVDANLGTPGLHTLLGMDRPEHTLGQFISKEIKRLVDAISPTPIHSLGLIAGQDDGLGAANPRPAQKNRMLTQLRQLPVDYVIVDLAPGCGFNSLDTLLTADTQLFVSLPEPTSVESTARLVKSAFLRKVRLVDGVAKLVSEVGGGCYHGIPTPHQLLTLARRRDETLTEGLRDAMRSFRPLLVINRTRNRDDLELGPELAIVGRRHLGLAMEYIGYLEDEDLVWLSVRKRRPLLVDYPQAKICKDIERITRRILARETPPEQRKAERLPVAFSDQNHYEILGLPLGATSAEIRRAFRRVKRMYDPESPVVYGVAPPGEVAALLTRAEQAHATLLDTDKRTAYNRTLLGDEVITPVEPEERPVRAPRVEPRVREGIVERADITPAPPPPAPEIEEGAEYTGELLRKVRCARGLALADIADRTKISLVYLQAIEQELFGDVPAAVYLRGFVKAVARCLGLPPGSVANSYMARYEAARSRDTPRRSHRV